MATPEKIESMEIPVTLSEQQKSFILGAIERALQGDDLIWTDEENTAESLNELYKKLSGRNAYMWESHQGKQQ